MNATTFIVKTTDLHDGRFVRAPIAAAKGGAVLRVDKFALTTNNITYAAFGEAMKYWNFFPAPDAGYGVIPVWGFGTVVESQADGLAVGERFYGYYPFASHVAVEPMQVGAAGFTDGAAHRQPMAPIYNRYIKTTSDRNYDPATEAEQLLFRPLFSTSFLIDDFLADAAFFGAKAVLLTSASSKTAYGTAYLLKKRGGIGVVGVTSPKNADFVRGLGCYDEVTSDIGGLPRDLPVAVVDMAGDVQLGSALHHHFGEALRLHLNVGATHWDADRTGRGEHLPGAKPQTFFAPSQAAKRAGEWGAAKFADTMTAAWHDFVSKVRDPAKPWVRVVTGTGEHDAAALYADVLTGKTPPSDGIILSLSTSN